MKYRLRKALEATMHYGRVGWGGVEWVRIGGSSVSGIEANGGYSVPRHSKEKKEKGGQVTANSTVTP